MDEMDKKQVGLTNSQIAELVWNLDDRDFLEVFEELNNRAKTKKSIGEFIDICLDEIRANTGY